MTNSWNWTCTGIGDALFGWTLSLPRDVAIILVGVILAVMLLAIRRLTTDQLLMQQIVVDERRLGELIHDARAVADRERLARCYRVRRLVAGRRARAELVAVCLSLVTLVAVMSWGGRRLDYLPIPSGEPIRFVARFPNAVIGEVVHVVPLDNVTVAAGWVRIVGAAVDSGVPCGKAEWTLQYSNLQQHSWIVVRLRNQSAMHRLTVGMPTYQTPLQRHNGGLETEVMLTPYRPLGILPSQIWPGLPGWSLLLTLVTGVVFFLGTRLLRSRHGGA